jgi:L-ascorbate peroxidase
MFHRIVLVLPLLSLALLALAGPLEQREAAPGLIDDLLKGALAPIQQLIKDVLSGTKSGIDNTISSKPLVCLSALDTCCSCTLLLFTPINKTNILEGTMYLKSLPACF